jgi:hypothetical protein
VAVQLVFHAAPPGRGRVLVLVLPEVGQQVLDRLLGLAPPGAELLQGGVDDDAVQPGGEPGAAVEPLDGPEGRKETVLHGVAGVLLVAEDAAGHGQQAVGVGADERLARRRVADAQAVEQADVVVRGRRCHDAEDSRTGRAPQPPAHCGPSAAANSLGWWLSR